jgi:rare lipoprotein A
MLILVLICLFLGSHTASTKAHKPERCGSVEGVASFYAGNFIGRKTANGEIFTSMEMTAAHKTLPFGTRLKITNKSNGKTATVRINDRGPYIKGRMLDLSLAAARHLAFEKQGLAQIVVESCR